MKFREYFAVAIVSALAGAGYAYYQYLKETVEALASRPVSRKKLLPLQLITRKG